MMQYQLKSHSLSELKEIASRLRRHILDMVYTAGSGHCGGSLSAVEILTALYFDGMRICPENPFWEDRDRFILSKGHACPVLYAVLAERGFFDIETLATLRQLGSILQGHPDMTKTPGIDMTAGSLGQGLSIGLGMALAARFREKDFHTFVLMGDGELNEGQVWEAALAGSKYRTTNLVPIVDYNRVQLDGTTDEIMPLGNLRAKWEAFGWDVVEVDGHDLQALLYTFRQVKSVLKQTVVIAHTVKGKGISFMEGKYEWHGKVLDEHDYRRAVVGLGQVK